MKIFAHFATVLAALLLAACGSTAKLRSRLDFLVDYGATKEQVVAEFGAPVSTTRTPDGEVCVFIPNSSSKTKTVKRVIDGKEVVESTTTSTPGRLKLTLTFRNGKLVNHLESPNR